MNAVDNLEGIKDRIIAENIKELVQVFVNKVDPIKVLLFGSYAKGSYTDDSDYDFYLVIDDGRDVMETMRQARRASINIKKRPVDIVVGTNSRFESKRRMADYTQMIEGEVERDGILLYERKQA